MDTERTVLGALSRGDPDLLAAGLEVRAEWQARSGLDDRGYALVEIAALIALDAVMFRRRRPLLRAAVVGGGAYMAGKNHARHSRQRQQVEEEQGRAHQRGRTAAGAIPAGAAPGTVVAP